MIDYQIKNKDWKSLSITQTCVANENLEINMEIEKRYELHNILYGDGPYEIKIKLYYINERTLPFGTDNGILIWLRGNKLVLPGPHEMWKDPGNPENSRSNCAFGIFKSPDEADKWLEEMIAYIADVLKEWDKWISEEEQKAIRWLQDK